MGEGRIGRAFVELEARTMGFQQGFDDAQERLAKAAEFVKGSPTLAFAALAATIAAVGVKAVAAAAEVDGALRRMQAAAPGTAGALAQVRAAIRDISVESGRTQEELAGVAARLAEMGESDPTEIARDLRVVAEVADATGQSMDRVAEGLDAIGDAFRLDAQGARDALVQITAITQGKVGLDEVLSVLERNGSALGALKVRAEDAAQAMAALIDAGVPKRKAGSLLESVLAQADAAGKAGPPGTLAEAQALQALLASINPTTVATQGLTGALAGLGQSARGNADTLKRMGFSLDEANALLRLASLELDRTTSPADRLAAAQRRVAEAATVNRNSAETLSRILKAELNAALIDLGNIALPAALGGLRALVDIFDHSGAGARHLTEQVRRLANLKPEEITALARTLRPDERAPSGNAWSGRVEKQTTPERHARDDILSAFQARGRGFIAELDPATLERLLVVYAELGQASGGLRRNEMELVAAISAVVQAKRTEAATTAAADDLARRKAAADKNAALDAFNRRLEEQRRATARGVEDSVAGDIAQYVAPSLDAALTAITHKVEGWRQAIKELPDAQRGPLEALIAQYDRVARAAAPVDDALRAAAKAVEDIQASADLGQVGNATGLVPAALFDRIRDTIAALRTAQGAVAEGSPKWEAIEAKINQLYGIRRGLIEKNAAARAQEAGAGQKQLEQLQLQALALQQAVQGALQLATAFGLVDQRTAGILTNLSQVGTSLPTLVKSIDLFGATAADPTKGLSGALSGVASAALPVVGGIASLLGGLFQEDPKFAEYRKAQEANTEALRQLSANIGDLASANVSGSKLGTAMRLALATDLPSLKKVPGTGLSFLDPDWAPRFSQSLRNAGLSNEDINEIARALHITLNNSAESWVAFVNALRGADLAAYTDTYAGSIKRLQDSFEVYGITDPTEKLRRTIKALSDPKTGIPGIASALQGLDVTNASDRAAAIERLQAFFEALASGSIDASQLGALLGGADLEQTLQQIKETIAALRGDGAPSGTGGAVVNRQVTEVTANRLVAVLDDSRTYLEMIARHTAVLAGGALPPLLPPAVTPDGARSAGAVIQLTVPVTVVVGAGADAATVGGAVGAAAGAAAARELSRVLGTSLALRAAATGGRVS
jgi:hypothetical protein